VHLLLLFVLHIFSNAVFSLSFYLCLTFVQCPWSGFHCDSVTLILSSDDDDDLSFVYQKVLLSSISHLERSPSFYSFIPNHYFFLKSSVNSICLQQSLATTQRRWFININDFCSYTNMYTHFYRVSYLLISYSIKGYHVMSAGLTWCLQTADREDEAWDIDCKVCEVSGRLQCKSHERTTTRETSLLWPTDFSKQLVDFVSVSK